MVFFLLNQYQPLSADLYERCSIDGWVEDVFIGDELNYWSEKLKNIKS